MQTDNILIVDPNTHMQQTLFSNINKYFTSDHIFISANSFDALWLSLEIKPRYVILNYDTLDGTANELIKKMKTFLKNFHSIVVYSCNCEEYTSDIKKIFFQLSGDEEIILVSYEDFISNTHVFFH